MYKVVRCPACKEWIVTRATKYVRCPACGRRHEISRLRVWFVGDSEECRAFIREMAEMA